MTHNGQGLLLCWNFITSSPELKPNKITDDEVKNKSSIEFRRLEPLLIANKKMRIYSSASIAANPLLCVRPSTRSSIMWVYVPPQSVACALGQGRLFCKVGFVCRLVCLANVPDLVCRLFEVNLVSYISVVKPKTVFCIFFCFGQFIFCWQRICVSSICCMRSNV